VTDVLRTLTTGGREPLPAHVGGTGTRMLAAAGTPAASSSCWSGR